ncbi:hypothetical protein L9F63_006762, partial [Diploptera punctata]
TMRKPKYILRSNLETRTAMFMLNIFGSTAERMLENNSKTELLDGLFSITRLTACKNAISNIQYKLARHSGDDNRGHLQEDKSILSIIIIINSKHRINDLTIPYSFFVTRIQPWGPLRSNSIPEGCEEKEYLRKTPY